MAGNDSPSVTRRAWTRMVLWGAVGLSLLPSCRRAAGGPRSPAQNWAELGRVWREMGSYVSRGKVDLRRRRGLKRLKDDMGGALDAVSASPELRVAFEGRWECIDLPYAMEEAFRRDHMTCYDMALTPAMRSGPEIEAQVEQLKALEAEGKLTTEAARKAAAALALQAEYLAQGALAGTPGAAHIKPGAGAQKAGEQLVEMTVDRPGMLGGVPPSAGTTERGKEGAR